MIYSKKHFLFVAVFVLFAGVQVRGAHLSHSISAPDLKNLKAGLESVAKAQAYLRTLSPKPVSRFAFLFWPAQKMVGTFGIEGTFIVLKVSYFLFNTIKEISTYDEKKELLNNKIKELSVLYGKVNLKISFLQSGEFSEKEISERSKEIKDLEAKIENLEKEIDAINAEDKKKAA